MGDMGVTCGALLELSLIETVPRGKASHLIGEGKVPMTQGEESTATPSRTWVTDTTIVLSTISTELSLNYVLH